MTKRLLSAFMALVLSISIVPIFNTQTQAASNGYNYKKALAYASKHWNDGKGLCAEFVSDCLKAGGITDVYETMVVNLYNQLLKKNHGKSYKLTLTGGTRGYVMKSANSNKLKAGDPIFFYCNACKRFTHVVISNGYNSAGNSIDYAHNNPHDGKRKTCTYPHCGTNRWTMYAIRMNDDGLYYGEKTDVDAPKISDYSNKENGIYFKWNAIKDAQTYRIYRKVPGKSWAFLKEIKETSYIDETVKNGQTFCYTIRAVKDKVRSQYHEGITAKFLSKVNITSTDNDGKVITIKWQGNAKADGYYLYRKINDGAWKRLKDFSSNKTVSYTDKKVSEGNKYYYRLVAFESGTLSAPDSKGVLGAVLKAPAIKSVVNDVTGVKVSWSAVKGAETYRVYRRSYDNKKWLFLDEVKDLFFIDETAESGKTARYTVRPAAAKSRGAFNTKGVSGYYLKTPEFTVVTADNGITLNWEKVSGAKSYYIYQKIADAKNWTRIAIVSDVNEFVVEDVVLNETYTYTIRAYNGSHKSSFIKDGIKCTHGVPETTTEIPSTDVDVEENTTEIPTDSVTDTTVKDGSATEPTTVPVTESKAEIKYDTLIPTRSIYEY